MMLKIFSLVILSILFIACKKAEDRRCWKSFGEQTKLIIPLDSIQEMKLFSGVTYVMHQSNERKVEIIGGENMVNLIDVKSDNYLLEITNQSACNFLRDFDKKVVVHVFYPRFNDVYAEVSDSLIFSDTIRGDQLKLEMREAGGVTVLTADLNNLNVTVSAGNGHFVAKGYAKYAAFKTQGQSFADCLALKSQFLYAYQNSRAPLKLNLENVEANIVIEGAGDIQYIGKPSLWLLSGNGVGKFIEY